MKCLLCSGKHSFTKCPLFGKPKDFVTAALSSTPIVQKRTRSPQLFDELFGGEIGVLQDVVDNPQNYDIDQRNLAIKVLASGSTSDLTPEDKARLDSIALTLATGGQNRKVQETAVETYKVEPEE